MYHKRIRLLGCLAAPIAAAMCFVPALAQAPATPPISVIVPYDYPAFQPLEKQPDPRAREVRAIVTRSPIGGDTVFVLINPAHLSAGTLGDALTVLHRNLTRPPAEPRGHLVAALGVPARERPVHPRIGRALAAKVEEIRARPALPYDRMGGVGHRIEITDLAPFIPESD
jgi:hypothetical protein